MMFDGRFTVVRGQSVADSVQLIVGRAEDAYRLGTRGGLEEALRLWQHVMMLYRSAGGPGSVDAATLHKIGSVHQALGQPDSALAYYEQALAIRRAEGNGAGEVETANGIGLVLIGLGRPDSALAYLAQVLPLARATNDRAGEASTLNNIGLVHDNVGQPDSSLAYYRLALPIQRAVGDGIGEARTLANIGRVHEDLGRPDSALAYHTAALPIARAAGDRVGEAAILTNMGQVLFNADGRPDSALVLYAQALAIQRAAGERIGEARTLDNMGAVHHRLGRADSAIAYYIQALPIRREAGDRTGEAATLVNIGRVQRDLGRPDSALAYFAHALPIIRAVGNPIGEAATLYNIGQVHHGVGRPDSALTYYARALPILRAAGNRGFEAMTIISIGVLQRDLGRPDSALAYLAQALPVTREVRDREAEASTLLSIGVVFDGLGRLDSALTYYGRALPIQRAVSDRTGEAATLHNIAAAHRALGRPDSALAYYGLALSIMREVGDPAREATALNNIGLVHANLGRPDSALAYYAQALPILRATRNRSVEAATLSNIGAALGGLGRTDSALAYLALALPIRRAVGDRVGEATTLRSLAHVHQKGSPPRPRIAVAYYDSAAAVLASIAERAGGDQNRLSFAEQQVGLFEDWTLASLALSPEIGPVESARAALAAAERGRAQALLDLMQRSASGASGTIGSSAATTAVGDDLAEQGARHVESIGHAGSTALVYMLARDTLVTWLIEATGDVTIFRSSVTADDLADGVAALRAGLGADAAAVGSRLATDGAADLDPARPGPAARESTGLSGFRTAATHLSAWLLPPALAQKLPAAGDLVIVPHGPLNLLPFAALSADSNGEPLGLRYNLRYAPSLATLEELANTGSRVAASRSEDAIVVGNPIMPRVRSPAGEEVTLGPLAGAEAEARWVADHVGAVLLSGGDATEGEIKRRLPSATLVHLATHGYAYSTEAKARDSFIALAPADGDDGLLTVGEVLDSIPRLHADLVVLSACQTGLGDLKHAEGTVGLQRAFLAKGARSVLVSLWNVSDEATELLMQRFYTHWRSGADKADALRRAQTEVRGAPGSRFHHPRFWAAFTLVGG